MRRVLNKPSNPGGWCSDQELKKSLLSASLVLCDDRVRDPSLILLIFRDRYDVPARKFPLEVLLFKVYVRLNHIQQRYILEYFF